MRPCFVGFSVEVGHGLVGAFEGLAVGVIDARAVGLDQIAFSIPTPDGAGRVDELSLDRAVFIEQSTGGEVCARLSCGVLAEEAEYILLDHATTLCVRWEFHFKDNGCVVAGSQVRDGAAAGQESNRLRWTAYRGSHNRGYADSRGCSAL